MFVLHRTQRFLSFFRHLASIPTSNFEAGGVLKKSTFFLVQDVLSPEKATLDLSSSSYQLEVCIFKGIRTGCKRKLSDLQKSSLFICGWRRLGSRFVPPSAVLRSSTWSVPEPSALRQWKLAGGAPRYCLKNENSWGIWRRFGQRPFLMWCFAPYHLFAPFSFNSFIILFVILMC